MAQWSDDMTKGPMVADSNPMNATAKQNREPVVSRPIKFLGVNKFLSLVAQWKRAVQHRQSQY